MRMIPAAFWTRARLAAAGALLLCAVACEKSADEPARESFSIQGTVQADKTWTPIAGVQVKVAATDGSGNPVASDAGSTTTDAAGHFSVSPFHYDGVASYDLTFSKEGYYDARSSVPANYFSSATHPTTYMLQQTMRAK